MNIFHSFASFLVSEWLWNVTWGSAYIPINIILLAFMLKLNLRFNSVSALALSITSNLFSFGLFTLIAHGIITTLLDITITSEVTTSNVLNNALATTGYLGILYTLLQLSFFTLFYKNRKFSLRSIAPTIILSNTLTSLYIYALLRLY